MKALKKFFIVIGILWLAVIFYLTGYLVGHKNLIFEKNYQPKIANLELKKPKEVDFGIFWKAWDIVNEKYVGTISTKKLVHGAVKGMVEALGDPYSMMMEESENKIMLEDLSGELEGIGAELSQKDEKIIVVAPLDGSPAFRAGIKPKDEIVAIDDQVTTQMNLDEAVSKIRGKAGTVVTLQIYRDGFTDPQDFKITREKIAIASVKWEVKNDNIGYIKITQFGDDTKDLIQKAARELASKNPKAIILDLRNNPGGYLETAVDVTSLFVPKGEVIVKEKYKDGSVEELKASIEPLLYDYNLVVLVNEGSASASEIVAGALRDIRGAKIVGKKSFGKGTVQELSDLDATATLRLTIAKWLTPKDQAIDKEGIKPDYEVDENTTDPGQDPQLDKALELVR